MGLFYLLISLILLKDIFSRLLMKISLIVENYKEVIKPDRIGDTLSVADCDYNEFFPAPKLTKPELEESNRNSLFWRVMASLLAELSR